MNHADILAYCQTKNGVFIETPPENQPLDIRVRDLIFVRLYISNDVECVDVACSFFAAKLYKTAFLGGFIRKSRYKISSNAGFYTVLLDGSVPDLIVLQMIDHSYDIIIKKLPKHERTAIKNNEVI